MQWCTQGFKYYLEFQEHGGNKKHTVISFGFIIVFKFSTDNEHLNYLDLEKTAPHSSWYISESVQYILRIWDF